MWNVRSCKRFLCFQIAEQAFRGSRVSLDIEAGAPVILVPHSSRTSDILVLDTGTLTVRNSFLLDGAEGTISGAKLQAEEEAAAEARSGKKGADVTPSAASMVDVFSGLPEPTAGECRSSECPHPCILQIWALKLTHFQRYFSQNQ